MSEKKEITNSTLNSTQLAHKLIVKGRKVLKKSSIQQLKIHFSNLYAFQHDINFNGPQISMKQIGEYMNLGIKTIYKLYSQWLQDPSFKERQIFRDPIQPLSDQQMAAIRIEHMTRILKGKSFLTQSQICNQMNKIQDLKTFRAGQKQDLTILVVSKLLKMAKYRKKRVNCVPKEKNTSHSIQIRALYCEQYKQLVQRNVKMYFLDQSGFNLYMTREKAWARPNEEITVNCPINKGKRFSLIAIIELDGLTGWRIIQGTYRRYEYLEFIAEMMPKLQQEGEKCLILDNCAIHDKQMTTQLAKDYSLNLLYLPPYSPQLNPIQNWFHQVKTKVRKTNYSGQKQLLQVMERVLKEYEEHDFSNYFTHTWAYVLKGINKQRF